MIVIKITNEFLHSPIWTYEDGLITKRKKPTKTVCLI